jgi:hypothetical protein
MSGSIISLLASLAFLVCAGQASAQAPIPTKTIHFHNNSAQTLYPVIYAGAKFGPINEVHDLWMQAQFDIPVADANIRVFQTNKIYRIYVNRENGVPPNRSVTITLPFYTQLLPVTAANLGKVNDQYIDWWNAMRVFVFDGKDAVTAGFNYSLDNSNPQKVVPPPPITPHAGAALPTCHSDNTVCEPLVINSYFVGIPLPVPVQLIEYTFGSALGPPLHKTFEMDQTFVNYNISGVDWAYLPAAIGAHGNASADNAYLGSSQSIADFRGALRDFAQKGGLWPQFVPAYYTAKDPTIPLTTPPDGVKHYPEPQVPSANVLYAESFRNPPPAPPILTSDTLKGIGELGDVGQGTLDLWTSCTTTTKASPTCTKIREVNNFFTNDYKKCFGTAPPVSDPNFLRSTFLRDVYGWAQFAGCSASLHDTLPNEYPSAIKTFCALQYNFFTLNRADHADVFNPYVELIHVTLASNAYAFSIDDEQAFKHITGDGVVITVAGTKGLENTKQAPLPTAQTFGRFCQGSNN